jgi:ubiquinone/menaquinone biosynthesis C-methylase UbiE
MTISTQWQLARDSAERYQTVLTPTILGPFAQALVEFAAPQMGEWIVDVGCGTGAAARCAAEAAGRTGKVAGVDVNANMIDVARSLPVVGGAPIEWHVTQATDLPLDDQSVDVVLCAQTLQFLPEKQPSLAEMQRVVKSSGRVVVSLWTAIEDNPYFYTLVETIARYVGPDTVLGLKSAFTLTDTDEIHSLIQESGFGHIEMQVTQLDLPMPKLTEFVPRHIQATPMATGFNQASKATQQTVIQEVAEKLNQYVKDGRTQIPFRSHMILCKGE